MKSSFFGAEMRSNAVNHPGRQRLRYKLKKPISNGPVLVFVGFEPLEIVLQLCNTGLYIVKGAVDFFFLKLNSVLALHKNFERADI
jgi:hypothetical protein